MRKEIIVLITALVAILAFAAGRTMQGPEPSISQSADGPDQPLWADYAPGWKTCPRCQSNQDRADAWENYRVEDQPYDPRDLSGVWGHDGVANAFRDSENPPPLTPAGEQWLAARGGEPPQSRNTPEMRGCDPLAYPRLFGYNYGMEFIMLPDRVIQFFEWGHTWRTIWTDGRQLPETPPELRWLGWSVGHWEGDTFVIESTGFDGRNWISEEMSIVERYRRLSYGEMEAELTIIDPSAYTEPWSTGWQTIALGPGAELWEYFCVPSDEGEFYELIHFPVAAETLDPG